MTAHVPDAPTPPTKLGTYYAHPHADKLYLDMMDAIKEIVAEAGYGLKTEARALRDMLAHDLPIAIRQVERDSCEHALNGIERLAKEHKDVADKQHLERWAAFVASGADLFGLAAPIEEVGIEEGLQTAVKYEARRRKEIRLAKLPRRLRTRRA